MKWGYHKQAIDMQLCKCKSFDFGIYLYVGAKKHNKKNNGNCLVDFKLQHVVKKKRTVQLWLIRFDLLKRFYRVRHTRIAYCEKTTKNQRYLSGCNEFRRKATKPKIERGLVFGRQKNRSRHFYFIFSIHWRPS